MKITPQELQDLVNQGYSDAEIAEKYGMHPDSIRKKRAKHAIAKMDYAKKLEREWPQIRQLNSEGYNDREIAEIVPGLTQAGVQKIRSKLGIPKSDYGQRQDKTYTCRRCGKEIVIRRKERKKWYCPECRDKNS